MEQLFDKLVRKIKSMNAMESRNDFEEYEKAKNDASDLLDDIIDARIEEARKHNRI